MDNVIGLGIGVPGPVDFESGVVYAVNLHWPNHVNVREIFSKMLDCPIYEIMMLMLQHLAKT